MPIKYWWDYRPHNTLYAKPDPDYCRHGIYPDARSVTTIQCRRKAKYRVGESRYCKQHAKLVAARLDAAIIPIEGEN